MKKLCDMLSGGPDSPSTSTTQIPVHDYSAVGWAFTAIFSTVTRGEKGNREIGWRFQCTDTSGYRRPFMSFIEGLGWLPIDVFEWWEFKLNDDETLLALFGSIENYKSLIPPLGCYIYAGREISPPSLVISIFELYP